MLRLKNRVFVTFLVIFIIILAFSTSAENRCVYSSNDKCTNKIAMTFDDGPHPKQTEEILNILDKYNVKATFFVIGVNVKNYGKSLDSVIKKGHEIGNHTYSHHVLKSMSKENILDEISNTENELLRQYGYEPKLLRPPCGAYDSTLIDIATENEMKIVLWNIDTEDWAHTSVDNITKNVLKNVRGGDIILFHDYISGKTNTAAALDILIPRLKEMGYEFVTVSELLQDT